MRVPGGDIHGRNPTKYSQTTELQRPFRQEIAVDSPCSLHVSLAWLSCLVSAWQDVAVAAFASRVPTNECRKVADRRSRRRSVLCLSTRLEDGHVASIGKRSYAQHNATSDEFVHDRFVTRIDRHDRFPAGS